MFSTKLRNSGAFLSVRKFSSSIVSRQVAEVKSMAEFKEKVLSEKSAFVDFYATWCGPCKAISPVVEKLSETHKDVKFFKVDVDDAQDIAAEYAISAMPTFMTFKDGRKNFQFVGASPPALKQMILNVKEDS